MPDALNIAPASVNEDDEDDAADALRDILADLERAQERFIAAKFPGSIGSDIGMMDTCMDVSVSRCKAALKKIGATDV